MPIPEDPIKALDLAESLLDSGEADFAYEVLDSLDRQQFIDEDRARLDALRMRTAFAQEEYWDAFKVAREFVDEHRFSGFAATIEDLEFQCGQRLLADDDDDGEIVLQHFVERFDASPHAPEALKLLGDFAFQGAHFRISEVRFAELLQTHPGSEWAAFARYRLAITAFRRVRGPEYDLDQMVLARNELQHYLSLHPERPEFRSDAEDSLAQLEQWISRRHVGIADFYRTIGNAQGEAHHLRSAADQFPTTAAGREAGARLGRSDPERDLAGGSE